MPSHSTVLHQRTGDMPSSRRLRVRCRRAASQSAFSLIHMGCGGKRLSPALRHKSTPRVVNPVEIAQTLRLTIRRFCAPCHSLFQLRAAAAWHLQAVTVWYLELSVRRRRHGKMHPSYRRQLCSSHLFVRCNYISEAIPEFGIWRINKTK
jgi:hypothetical protein